MTDMLNTSIDDLLNANMEDLDDLPPSGIPPTGHYNLTVTASIEEMGENKVKLPVLSYVVDAVNELKDPEQAGEVAVGQKFREVFFITKKDGTANTYAIGSLKARLAPHAERFGVSNLGELIKEVNQIAISASLKRKVNPKNDEQFNVSIENIVIL